MSRRGKQRSASLGYSLIEVMAAVAVMIVGFSGIVLMQGASIRANQDGYETSVANTFASTWLERLKRDATRWNDKGDVALGTTTYLNNHSGLWFAPTGGLGNESCAADYNGYEITPSYTAQARYIANVRNMPLHYLGTAGNPADINAVQVTVRVSWPRSFDAADYRIGPFLDANPCARELTPDEVASTKVRTVYLSTVVHWIGVPQ